MDLSGSSYRISSHFIHYFNSPSITTGLQWIKGNLVRIRMSLFSVSLRNAKSCKFSKIFLSHTDVSYYDRAEVWVVILKWPVLIYQPFSKSVGLLVEFYNRAVHIHITYTTYLMQNFFNLIWYDTFAHTRPSPLESQKLSVSGQVGHSDAHFQMKKKVPSNCGLDVDMTFPLPAIGVCRANPDVIPFPAPKLLMGDWDKYATDGCGKAVMTLCDRGPCWTWEEPKTPPATSAETFW